MKRKVLVKGRINRPSYEGYVTFHLREGETEEEAIARTLRQTSCRDGVSSREITIKED